MAPATQSFDAPQRTGEDLLLPVAAQKKIYLGTLVALGADGYAVPSADTAGLRVIGRSQHDVDNTDGDAGDQTVNVRRGAFQYDNSAVDPVTKAHVGKACYVEDDQTVASDSDNHVVAGLVLEVTTTKVWVDTRLASVLAQNAEEASA